MRTAIRRSVKGAKPVFGKREVNALMKFQTNRVVARQPGKHGRPVDAVRAPFAEPTQRAGTSNRLPQSKALAERTVP
jgi:hypothetical protein